jgi:hypothetical protein
LIALRKAAADRETRLNGLREDLRKRLNLGERMMLQRRAVDGGWNYGNRLVLGHELPSYPETTALALLGLMGVPDFDSSGPLAVVADNARTSQSRLARAWASICLRAYDRPVPDDLAAPDAPDGAVHLAAIEALGTPDGNFRLFKTEPVR